MIIIAGHKNPLECLHGNDYLKNSRTLNLREGRKVIDLILKEKVRLIFIEETLEDMSGFDLLETLSGMAPLTPTVFIAKKTTKQNILKAFRCGAKDVLEEPVREDVFNACMKRVACDPSMNLINWSPLTDENAHFRGLETKKHYAPESGRWEIKDTMIPRDDENDNQRKKGKSKDALGAARLSLSLFGKIKIQLNGHDIENSFSRRGKSIFICLIFNRKKGIHRDVLMDRYWQDAPFHAARNCLNVTIHGLRKLLFSIDPMNRYILYRNEHYAINPDIEMSVDTDLFEKNWKEAERLERRKGLESAIIYYEKSIGIYSGDFMEEDLYENWSSAERDRYRDIYIRILEKLSLFYYLKEQYSSSIDYAKRILYMDNCREDVYRRLMRCYQKTGKRDLALKLYKRCEKNLWLELEISPENRTRELYMEIKKETFPKKIYEAI